VHKSAIVGENSFNVVLLFTRAMMREILKHMSGHFKNKIIALLCDVLHPSNFSFSGKGMAGKFMWTNAGAKLVVVR